MKLMLKDFQDEAVALLRSHADTAATAAKTGKGQALVLAAPTGSGKTVIATAWMESVLQGDGEHPADPQATFLWLTDMPELNEQTKRKMLSGSSMFGADDLVTVDASFDAESFAPGKVYFLNTQKLGKGTNLVERGDKRSYTLWQTVNNTASERPGSFWLVIDEAHKGMGGTKKEREDAKTIVQRFITGSEVLDSVPLILGISATPQRFTDLLAGTDRISWPVTVDPESVRTSGLLKEAITLWHPEETQPSDMTMLRAAAVEHKRYAEEWAKYADKESAPDVKPVLVVQVQDAAKGSKDVTKTDIEAALNTVEEVLGPLGEYGVAHSFQEGQTLILSTARRFRYIAPVDIQDDPDLQVVFFKLSLSTGWDCPRAEVMMSFRTAQDRTYIAQLVGRMVRTPLARSVSTSEYLNSVCLYLPHYDAKELDKVIEYLTDPDPEVGIATRVQRGEKLITLKRNPDAQAAFDAAKQLITYKVEKVSKQSNIRRILRLGRLLAWDKLDADAGQRFTEELVAVLVAERKKVEGKDEFAERIKEAARIDVRGVTVAVGGTEKTAVTSSSLVAVAENVEHAFADAGRKLGGGLHAAYRDARAAEDNAPALSAIKLELYALLEDAAVGKAVEDRAGELLSDELDKHKAAVMAFPEERRQLYRHIRRQAGKPASEPWELPDSIEGSKDGTTSYDRHLYVDDDGNFAATLNDWEDQVLTDVLKDKDVVGWLRNDPRKQWSFTVPYEHGKQGKPMYPDFVVFRKQGAGIVCDILEPHSLSFEDSAAKAKGLAAFAKDHGDEFGRIQLIAKLGGSFKTLRLDDTDTRDNVLAVATSDHLKLLFESA